MHGMEPTELGMRDTLEWSGIGDWVKMGRSGMERDGIGWVPQLRQVVDPQAGGYKLAPYADFEGGRGLNPFSLPPCRTLF